MPENKENIVRVTLRIDADLYGALEKRVQERKRKVGQSHSVNTEVTEALRAWLSLPPPAMEEPRGHVRRVLDGVQALYARQDHDAKGATAMLESLLKVAGEKQPSGRRQRAGTD